MSGFERFMDVQKSRGDYDQDGAPEKHFKEDMSSMGISSELIFKFGKKAP